MSWERETTHIYGPRGTVSDAYVRALRAQKVSGKESWWRRLLRRIGGRG